MKKLWVILILMIMLFSLGGCGKDDAADNNAAEKPASEYKVDPKSEDLTITDGKETVVFRPSDLEKMGTKKITYSGRNKRVKNARVFKTYEGVELKKVIEEAGFDTEKATMKVICSDKYSREYRIDDLYGLYSYKNNESNKKIEVYPMIALVYKDDAGYPSPFKLAYGQADYDDYDNNEQDFNMQGWASYVQYIEMGKEN